MGAAHNFNEDLTVVLSSLKKAALVTPIGNYETRRWILEAIEAGERMAKKADILLNLPRENSRK